MEPRRTLTIHLDVHWRAIVVAACIVAVLVLALNVTRAQGSGASSVDHPEVQAARVNIEGSVAGTPDQPLPGCGDGLPTVNGECMGPEAVGRTSSSPHVAGRVTAAGYGVRQVYVTEDYFYPDQALTACGSGYHMASLWEILDTSNWVYDYDHPAAHVQDDSGYGPPSLWSGWIRTGYWSNEDPVAPTVGMANCLAWTSRNEYGFGTTVRLSSRWETEPGEIMTWEAALGRCDDRASVWCARN